jgi:hypothetical protein
LFYNPQKKNAKWLDLLAHLSFFIAFSPFVYQNLDTFFNASSINFFQGIYILFILYTLFRLSTFTIQGLSKAEFSLRELVLKNPFLLYLFFIVIHPFDIAHIGLIKIPFWLLLLLILKASKKTLHHIFKFALFVIIFLDFNRLLVLLKSIPNLFYVWEHINEYFILHAMGVSPIIIIWAGLTLYLILSWHKWNASKLLFIFFIAGLLYQTNTIEKTHKYLNQQFRGLKPFKELVTYEKESNQFNIPKREEINDFKKAINYNFIRSHFDKNDNFGIHFKSSFFKVQKYGQRISQIDTNYTLDLIPEEYESFQTIITAFEDTIKIDSVWLDNSECIQSEIFIQEDIYCKPPAYKQELKGWVPDPLIPISNSLNRKIIPKTSKSLWFNIKALDLCKTENAIKINIKLKKNHKDKISYQLITKKIKLNWFDINLEKTTNFKILIGYGSSWKKHWYDNDTANLKNDIIFFNKYGFTPISFYSRNLDFPSISQRKAIIKKQSWHSLGFFNPKLREVDSVLIQMDSIRNWAKEKGILDYSFWYCYDEIDTPSIKALRLLNEKRKDTIPILTCGNEYTIDTTLQNIKWVVLPEDEGYIKKTPHLRYICNVTETPKYNFFIDQHAIKATLSILKPFVNDIEGFLYYDVVNWGTNCFPKVLSSHGFSNDETYLLKQLKNGIKWPNVHWNSYTYKNYNGDGVLVYPGEGKNLLPSIRLVNIREAIKIIRLIEKLNDKEQIFFKEKFKNTCNSFEKYDLSEKDMNSFLNLKRQLYQYNSKP